MLFVDKCRQCDAVLTEENWAPSFARLKRRICKKCHNEAGEKRYYADINKARIEASVRQAKHLERHPDVQAKRAKSRLREVDPDALSPEEVGLGCKKCNVELTVENWPLSFRRRGTRRCKKCHAALTADYAKRRGAEYARERQRKWRERHAEAGTERYRADIEGHAERNRRRLWKFKSAALIKMGGKCIGCGCTDSRVLHINHKDGRPENEKKMGLEMYAAILDGTRATDDLDIRCANCNILYEFDRGKRALPTGIDPDLSHYDRDAAPADIGPTGFEPQSQLSLV